MSELEVTLDALTLRFGEEIRLVSLPGAGVAWCADSARRAEAGLIALGRRALEETKPGLLARALAGLGDPVVREVSLMVEPAVRQAQWLQPVELKLHVICGQVGALQVARVPVLGIECFASDAAELDRRIEAEIRTALQRAGAGKSLAKLMALLEPSEVEVGSVSLRLPAPAAGTAERKEPAKKSVLETVTTDLTLRPEPAFEVGAEVAQLAGLLGGQPPQHVLLVGPSGVGKSALVRELVRRRAEFGFRETPFHATTGTRLVAGMSGFGEWQERVGDLAREAAKARAILLLGSLVELLQTGRHIYNQQGIASFLRPHLARNEFLAIAECTPEQIPVLEREDPHLLELFVPLTLTEPDSPRGRRILAAAAPGVPGDALAQVDALHRRYATASAYPGRPLRFLKNLQRDHEQSGPPTPAEVIRAFTRETGLPPVILDDALPLEPNETRAWFEARVIGQPTAVAQVTALLTVVKQRLARPQRPLASLLFIGPTGVGKTEMARSLAAFLFGDPERVTRFDMSEFATPFAVHRLLGGPQGEGQLTARVREQPFCVLLFDEFEKAHPQFFDLLLPVLGEGRLTDSAGRLADFTNAVVILTSNLGATTFQTGRLGFAAGADQQRDAREHFTAEVRRALRPELFNRFDRIVPFSPLDEASVLAIAERELALIRTLDGLRFREFSTEPGVAAHFAQVGFDARYGARPLKRAVGRGLLVPLADAINAYPANQLLHTVVRLRDGAVRVDVGSAGVASETREAKALGLVARDLGIARRDVQALGRCSALNSLANERARLEAEHQRLLRRWPTREEPPRLGRIRGLQERVAKALAALEGLETEIALAFHERIAWERPGFDRERGAAQAAARGLIREVLEMRFADPGFALVSVYAEEREWLIPFARAIHRTAETLGSTIRTTAYELGAPAAGERKPEVVVLPRPGGVAVKARLIEFPVQYLAVAPKNLLGLSFRLTGPSAFSLWAGEAGWHTQHLGGKKRRHALVEVVDRACAESDDPKLAYAVPEGIERRGGLVAGGIRRNYQQDAGVVSDGRIGTLPWKGELAEVLRECLTLSLQLDERDMLNDPP